MALQIRRGTDTQRQSTIFAQGELVYTTDLKDLFVGDGVTSGGTAIAPVKSVNGLSGTVALTTDNITQGTTNKYYNAATAKTDVAAALTSGNAGNTGITFSYNSSTNVINAVISTQGTLAAVVNDTNPTLGGNLILNNKTIQGTGTVNITGSITASTNITAATGYMQTQTLRLSGNRLTTTDASFISFGASTRLEGADSASGYLSIVNNSVVTSALDVENHNNSADGGFISLIRSRGTTALPTRLQDLDAIYTVVFAAQGPSAEFNTSAWIQATVDGPTGSSYVPGKLSFAVANASGTIITPFTVNSSGYVTAAFGLGTGANSQALADLGAASLTNVATHFTTTAASTATLAAGTEGQIKTFAAKDVTLGNMVITVTNAGWKSSGTGTITFSSLGAACTMQYIGSKWFCIGNNGATFA